MCWSGVYQGTLLSQGARTHGLVCQAYTRDALPQARNEDEQQGDTVGGDGVGRWSEPRLGYSPAPVYLG